MCYFLKAK